MADKPRLKQCPVCGVEDVLEKQGKRFHCTDKGCGVTVTVQYLSEQHKAASEHRKKLAEG
ncbi:hypothetical protein LCGC14_2879080 [marine sediment metagenome]|uniref:Uncharacterized protein n=1 Tax=marine sediment metagenome TaxID=412755 RepID=A0A0F9A8S6_9ZZZZ